MLTCVPADHSGFGGYQRTAVIVSSIAAAAVLVAVIVVWRQYLSTRPQWLRERIMQQKRIKGAPKCTKPGDKVTVSIVVTDVKDFSELTRRCPELMNKAMGGHNNILRKACQVHAGYVLDQEGDSWTVAFHEAEDAVGFSLQVRVCCYKATACHDVFVALCGHVGLPSKLCSSSRRLCMLCAGAASVSTQSVGYAHRCQ